MSSYPLTVPLDTGTLRIRRDDSGELWFVAKDVCDQLGYVNDSDALRKHVDDEDRSDGVANRDSIGRTQRMAEINESGLYSLIFAAAKRKPEARVFKRKVTSEILPQIRKTGSYSTTPEPAVTYEAPTPAAIAPKTSTKAKLEIELTALREAFVHQTRALEALARQVAELAKAKPALPAPRQVRCHRSLPVNVPCVETEGPAGRFLWLNEEAWKAYRTTGALPQTH